MGFEKGGIIFVYIASYYLDEWSHRKLTHVLHGAGARDGADVVGNGDERGARQILAANVVASLLDVHVPETAQTQTVATIDCIQAYTA